MESIFMTVSVRLSVAMFTWGLPGVPKVFCSEGPLFRRFIVPKVR